MKVNFLLKFKIEVIVYSVVICIFILVGTNFYIQPIDVENNLTVKKLKEEILKIELKENDFYKEVRNLENYLKENQIELINLKINKPKFEITILEDFEKIKLVLNILEKNNSPFKIESFDISKTESKKLSSKFVISVSKKDYEYGDKKENFYNPFYKDVIAVKSLKVVFVIDAILNGKVLINEKWYEKNQSFKGYKIVEVKENYVFFLKDNEKIKVGI